jgi:fructose-1,6-bisphosphatase/inositol monophosphatase family enzyme
VGALASPTLAGRLRTRSPAVGIALFGILLGAFAIYLQIVGAKIDLALILVPTAISGMGFGLFAAPLQPLLLTGLQADDIAAASAVVPSVEQLGSSFGLATVSALFFRSHTIGAAVTTLAVLAAGSVVLAALTLTLRSGEARDSYAESIGGVDRGRCR